MSVAPKYAISSMLCFQNAIAVIAIKYNIIATDTNAPQSLSIYIMSNILVIACTELLKYVLCWLYILKTESKCLPHSLYTWGEKLQLAIISMLYTIQGICAFIAIKHLSPEVYQVTTQLKILTTSLMAFLVLNKKFGYRQILALCGLIIGCILVNNVKSSSNSKKAQSTDYIGVCTCITACFLSSFCGIWLEYLAKSKNTHSFSYVMHFNFELSLMGLYIYYIFLCCMHSYDSRSLEMSFFKFNHPSIILVIGLHSLGGILVAAVMIYADNVFKCFVVAVSILISTVISVFVFSTSLTMEFCIGAVVVLGSSLLYCKSAGQQPQPQIVIEPKQ